MAIKVGFDFDSGSLLSVDEEFELAKKSQAGDLESRKILIRKNMRYALKLANKYARKNVDLEDLYGAAFYGLVLSAASYKPNRNTRFVVYAAKGISQSIIRELNFHYHIVSMGQEDKKIASSLSKEMKETDESDKDSVLRYVSDKINAPIKKVLEVHEFMKHPLLSLEVGSDYSEDGGVVAMPSKFSTQNEAGMKIDYEIVCEEINNLPNKVYREVMSMIFGLNGYESMSGEEIGSLYGKTKAWVSQVKKKCLDYIRRNIGEDAWAA